jgi:pantothenate kinase
MGSGVSILKITGPKSFERVSGTSLGPFAFDYSVLFERVLTITDVGGGTFWGLARLLAPIESKGSTDTAWAEVMALSNQGSLFLARKSIVSKLLKEFCRA